MRVVGFDTETHLIDVARQAPRLVCVSHWEGSGLPGDEGRGAVLGREDGIAWFRRMLDDPEVILVAHNAAFDAAVMLSADFSLGPALFQAYEDGRIRCTMLRDILLDIAMGKFNQDAKVVLEHAKVGRYSLAGCVHALFDTDLSSDKVGDVWRLRYDELDGVPVADWPPEAVRYALDDSMWAVMLWGGQQVQEEALTEKTRGELRLVEDRKRLESVLKDGPPQARAAFALRLMECWGMTTDSAAVDALEKKLVDELALLDPTLREAGIKVKQCSRRKKGDCPQPCGCKEVIDQKVLTTMVVQAYVAQGSMPPMTPTKRPSTATGTLTKSGDPVLVRLGEASVTKKLYSTYIPALRRGEVGVVHPRYMPLMRSGRISCREPNLTNPPREGGVRECFVPRKNWLYVTCDYDSAELRSLAQACLDLLPQGVTVKLAKRYQADPDFDPHAQFAAGMLKISYERAIDLKRGVAAVTVKGAPEEGGGTELSCGHVIEAFVAAGDKVVCKECVTEFKAARQRAKAAMFGFPGGLGARSFISFAAGYGVTLTEDDAKDIKAAWLEQWTEMSSYFTRINNMLDRMVDHPILQVRSGRVRGDNRYTSVCNTFFQGLTADGAKRALFLVAWECYAVPTSPLHGSRPVILMHDEIIMESPEDKAPEAADRLAEVMVAAMSEFTPDVPSTAAAALMRRWYKGAEPVRDADGRLIPWEPKEEVA